MNDAVLATSPDVCYLTTEGQEICDVSCVRDGSHGRLSMTNLSWVHKTNLSVQVQIGAFDL